MLTRKSIDTVLLSVGAEKLSQREWDWMKMLKPMTTNRLPASRITRENAWNTAISSVQGERKSSSSSRFPASSRSLPFVSRTCYASKILPSTRNRTPQNNS